MSNKKNIIFRLKNDLKPISWQLPYNQLLLPRLVKNDKGGFDEGPEIKIHYIPGAPSIYKDDYKGQDEPQQIIFEDGELEVRPSDALLLEIVRRHPWNHKWYEEVNAEAEAENKLKDFELKDLASDKIREADEIEIKAIGLAVIGSAASNMSPTQCRAALKEIAFTDPNRLLGEMDNPNYANKYIAALAFLKDIVKTNESNTAIVWVKSNNLIARVAVGELPLDKLTELLSGGDEQASVLLQTLGEMVGQSTTSAAKVVNFPAPVVEEKKEVVAQAETEAEIEARLKAKFEKQYEGYVPAGSVEAVKEVAQAPAVTEEVKTNLEDNVDANANADANQNADANAKSDANADANVNADANAEELVFDPSKTYTLEELQKLYPVVCKVAVPINKKNDAEWLLKAIIAGPK